MTSGPARRRRRFVISLTGSLLPVVLDGGRLLSTPPVPTTTRVMDGSARPVPDNWRLAYREGFAGSGLARARWNDCHWWAVDGGCTIATNNELEWYRPGNVSVSVSVGSITNMTVAGTTSPDGPTSAGPGGVTDGGTGTSDGVTSQASDGPKFDLGE